MQLGDVVERQTVCGVRRFVVTSLVQRLWILTPLPEGMTAMDLGRKFPAALVEHAFTPEGDCDAQLATRPS